MKLKKEDIITIPNFLSAARFLMIPIFVALYLTAENSTQIRWAGCVLILSGITDFLDGFIARTFHQISELGKAMDPIADKLTQAAVIFCFVFRYPEIIWLVILFVVKELFMGINGLILIQYGKKLGGAKWYGKLSTAVFDVVVVILLIFPDLDYRIIMGLFWTTGFFLALSFILYIPVFVKMYQEVKQERK